VISALSGILALGLAGFLVHRNFPGFAFLVLILVLLGIMWLIWGICGKTY
jgi:hypothetical protein